MKVFAKELKRMKKLISALCVAIMIGSIVGCGSSESGNDTLNADEESLSQVETANTVEMSDDMYERIAADIIALSANPDAPFDYEPNCIVQSIEKDADTGANVVSVVITKELGEGVFPRIISAINKSTTDPSLIVGMEDDPENMKNTKVVLCDATDGHVVAVKAKINEQGEANYLIVYYGD